jgi:hypothetical protein
MDGILPYARFEIREFITGSSPQHRPTPLSAHGASMVSCGTLPVGWGSRWIVPVWPNASLPCGEPRYRRAENAGEQQHAGAMPVFNDHDYPYEHEQRRIDGQDAITCPVGGWFPRSTSPSPCSIPASAARTPKVDTVRRRAPGRYRDGYRQDVVRRAACCDAVVGRRSPCPLIGPPPSMTTVAARRACECPDPDALAGRHCLTDVPARSADNAHGLPPTHAAPGVGP